MIAKVYLNSTVDEVRYGIGQYFYAKIKSFSFIQEKRTFKRHGKDHSKIYAKKVYQVVPIGFEPDIIDKYLEVSQLENFSVGEFRKLHYDKIRTRVIDKTEYVHDGMLDHFERQQKNRYLNRLLD